MQESYITVLDEEPHGWRFGSGMAIYTERFLDGRLLGASFKDNGVPLKTGNELRDCPAFDLVIDGESLAFDWEYLDFTITTTDDGLPCGTLTLRHARKPVELRVTTQPGGFGCFRRTLQITNTSPDQSLGLTAVTPFCGVLWQMTDALADNLRDTSVAPYAVGHFRDGDWANEGNFLWQDIPLNTELTFGSSRGRSGYNHPFCLLRNNLYGGYFWCALAWSANWKMTAHTEYTPGPWPLTTSRLRFSSLPSAIAPMRIIAPGETISAPEVHFGTSHADLDDAVQRWHSYLRARVLKTVGEGRQPVIFNHWGFMEHDLNEERLKAEIDIAAEVGAELFMVDAGWYASTGAHWWETTGNWETGDRLPNDLFPVFAYARAKGMATGLWVEIESAGKESRLATEHPDWFITRYGHPIPRVLDLAKPVVRDYVRAEIFRLIDRYQLDMFRLDYNLDAWEGGFNLVDGRMENTLWRHVEAIYDIFDEVARRYPHLLLENCSSGGGRTDIGQLSRFTTTWTSDWQSMPRTVRIFNGMSLALPPEYLNRLFGEALNNTNRGNAETLLHLIILAHPTLSGLTPALAQANPALLAAVKKYLGIYKSFIRPFHRTARVYHHTPEIPGADGRGWCALEHAAADRRHAVAGVFRLVNASEDAYRLRFRGLDPALVYRLTIEPDGVTSPVSGYALMQDGVTIRLDAALTSKLLLAEAKG